MTKILIDRAMQQALEALKEFGYHGSSPRWERAVNDLRTALEQPPLPVQPERQPLTDEEIQKIWDVAAGAIPGWSRHIAYARAIEAAHGIKEGT